MSNNTNTTKKNTIGCDNLVDNAFVPVSGQNYRAPRQQDAIREEAGFKPAKPEPPVFTLDDLFEQNYRVEKGFFGTPELGVHTVKLREYKICTGRDDRPYMKLTFMDLKTFCCWDVNVGAERLPQMLSDISFSNKGLLSGKSYKDAFNIMKQKKFDVWTIVSEKGKLATYFNKDSYERRLYVVQSIEGEYELKKLRQRELDDEKARMAEEASYRR